MLQCNVAFYQDFHFLAEEEKNILPEFEFPGHFHREKEPCDNPQEQMEDSSNYKDQHRSIQRAFVNDGEVVEQWSIAHRQGNQSAHGGSVGEIHPHRSLAFGQGKIGRAHV